MLHRWIDEVEVKRCSLCREWQPLDSFAKDANRWDGLQSRCRMCDAATAAKYWAENRESGRRQHANYRAENPEKIQVSSARYYVEHREEKRVYSAQYHAENPEKARAKWARRRAREMGITVSPVTAIDLKAIRAEHNGVCPYCGKRIVEGHFDHIVSLAKGGTHSVDNLAWVCARCNRQKRDKSLLVFLLDRARMADSLRQGAST